MLCRGIQRWSHVTTAISVRFSSSKSRANAKKKTRSVMPVYTKVKSTSNVTWSSGEVTHPAPLDCPLGNKGEYPQKLPDGGIQYFGFTYYPRFPDAEDPPFEPAPLHMVIRVRTLRGRPFWEKDIMKAFGLDKRRTDFKILKNNPENNAVLWKVKHLIEIIPITVPKDLPEDADPRCCFLKDNGEFTYSPSLRVDEAALKKDEVSEKTKWPIKFVEDFTRKNWEYPWQLKLC